MKTFGRIGMFQNQCLEFLKFFRDITRSPSVPSTVSNSILLTGNIVASGSISTYNASPTHPIYGVTSYSQVVRRRIRWQGFLVFDENIKKWSRERDQKVAEWIRDGSYKSVDHITQGIDNAINGFLGMLKGENLGKSILKIADLD